MRATLIYGAGDVQVVDIPDPKLANPSDAIVRVARACVCGSDLHPYRDMPAATHGRPIDDLLPDVLDGTIEPGKVFDRTVTLDDVPAGYQAMADREALKVMVTP
jgi:threonine dehydrogenase-like Zn-dependent dehydrogenase